MGASGIYAITHETSGRRYIGQSVDVDDRLRHHRNSLLSGRHHNIRLQRAVSKYGIDKFRFEVMLIVAPENLTFYEQRLIDGFDAVRTGFNIAPAAQSNRGTTRTPEQRERIAASQKESRNRPEVRAAMSSSIAASRRRPEVIEAISRGTRDGMAKPAARAAFMLAISAPAYREARIAAAREPSRRAAVAEKVRLAYESPEVRERHRAACSTPEYRARHAAFNSSPEIRAARAAVAKAAWADPIKRAARIEAIRASKRKAM